MSVALRPVTEGDQPFLLELYASTRLQQHPHPSHHVVLGAGDAVGRLWVDREADAIHILDLTISPAVRLVERLGFTKVAEQGYHHLYR